MRISVELQAVRFILQHWLSIHLEVLLSHSDLPAELKFGLLDACLQPILLFCINVSCYDTLVTVSARSHITNLVRRYLFIIDCTLNLMVFYGIMGVYVTADLSLANVLSSFFYGLWNLFTGFLIGVNQMAGWWKWL